MDIPIRRAEVLYHLGTLDPSARGQLYKSSLEGHLLSVSNRPDAWERIAKLGGSPLYSITADDGLMLLDIHATLADSELMEMIEAWGKTQGLCRREPRWRAWRTDEEGAWRYLTCLTEREADLECDETEVRPNGLPLVEEVEVAAGTALLSQVVRIPDIAQFGDISQYLSILWAREHLPDLSGVWWDDELDVYAYSAPRGGIFPDKMQELTFALADRHAVFQRLNAGVGSLPDLDADTIRMRSRFTP